MKARGAVVMTPAGKPTVLQGTFLRKHPENVIFIVPVTGPVTSPALVSVLHTSLALATVSRRLAPLVDVNGFENGPLNSGSADADAAVNPLTENTVTRQSPTIVVRFM